MTEHVRVIPNDGTSELLDGDCGVVLGVLKPCPDEPHRILQCACGAEIYPRRAAGDATRDHTTQSEVAVEPDRTAE